MRRFFCDCGSHKQRSTTGVRLIIKLIIVFIAISIIKGVEAFYIRRKFNLNITQLPPFAFSNWKCFGFRRLRIKSLNWNLWGNLIKFHSKLFARREEPFMLSFGNFPHKVPPDDHKKLFFQYWLCVQSHTVVGAVISKRNKTARRNLTSKPS